MSVPQSISTLEDTGRHHGIRISSIATYWSVHTQEIIVMFLEVSHTFFCLPFTPLGSWIFMALGHLPTLCGPHHFLSWALPIYTFNPVRSELLWFSLQMAYTDVFQGKSFLSLTLYHQDTLKNKFMLSLIKLYLNKLNQIQTSGFLQDNGYCW